MTDRSARVGWFVSWMFIFSTLFCWALLQALMTTEVRWIALSWGCIAGMATLAERKRQHDKLCEPIIRPLPLEEPKTAIVTPDREYVPTVQSHNGQRIRFGKIKKSRADWEKLARAILDNDNRVARDVVATAGVFESITRKWNGIYAEFERMGWAKDRKLTDDGIEFFAHWASGEIPPYPNPTDAQNMPRP